MIVRRGLDLLRLVRLLGPLMAALVTYDVVVTALYVWGGQRWLSISELPLPLLGSAIVLIVTIRNNAAYARWWEARGLWGAVVNNSRSFARSVALFVADPARKKALVHLQVAYAVALRCHLLKQEPWPDLAGLVGADVTAGLRGRANVPVAIQQAIVAELRETGLDVVAAAGLDRVLGALSDAQGGLERIKNTPLPRQYNHFPMMFSRIYCVLLPVGLLGELGVLTPIGSTLIGFMFLALDRMGQDLEDPFEGTIHDVPMRAIVRTIEIDLLQGIGVSAVPPAVVAEDGVLW